MRDRLHFLYLFIERAKAKRLIRSADFLNSQSACGPYLSSPSGTQDADEAAESVQKPKRGELRISLLYCAANLLHF